MLNNENTGQIRSNLQKSMFNNNTVMIADSYEVTIQ